MQHVKKLVIPANGSASFSLSEGFGMGNTTRLLAINSTDRCNMTYDLQIGSSTEEINGPTVLWKPIDSGPAIPQGQPQQWAGGDLSFQNTESHEITVTVTQVDW